MRVLCIVLAIVATAWPVHADTVLIQEDFEGPVGGLVDGWNGWMGNGGVVISKTTIDRGTSVTWNGSATWPFVSKPFSYSPHAGEQYELIATLNTSDADGGYSDIRLVASVDSDRSNGMHVAAQIDKGVLGFEQNGEYYDANGEFIKNYIRVAQSAATMDVRLIISDSEVQCYYRNRGATTWEFAGVLEARNALATYNSVRVGGRRVGGNIDSIRLVVKSPEAKK